jgi:hypothetical protein
MSAYPPGAAGQRTSIEVAFAPTAEKSDRARLKSAGPKPLSRAGLATRMRSIVARYEPFAEAIRHRAILAPTRPRNVGVRPIGAPDGRQSGGPCAQVNVRFQLWLHRLAGVHKQNCQFRQLPQGANCFSRSSSCLTARSRNTCPAMPAADLAASRRQRRRVHPRAAQAATASAYHCR